MTAAIRSSRYLRQLPSLEAGRAVEKQNPGRVIGAPRRTTGTIPGCSSVTTGREADVDRASSWAFYERHFAQARLQHYLIHTDGDQSAGMEQYAARTLH